MAPEAPGGSGGGNTITPPPPHGKVRISAAKRWCFTWNNYPEDWLALMAPGINGSEWVAGREVGAEGTPHIQGYVEFATKVRPAGYKGMPTEIHWEKCKGDRASNVAYCTKDGDVVKQSTIKVPRKCVFPVMDRWWQVQILDIIKQEPDDRTIYWYWSEAGNMGKTTFSKYLCVNHDACLLSGKGADVRNGALTWKKDKGAYPDLCIFPVPRSFNSEYLSYEAMENIKDALFYSGKYEGGTVCDPCPHLLVFSNFPPDESKMSPDRWVVVNIDSNFGGVDASGVSDPIGGVDASGVSDLLDLPTLNV